MIDMQTNVDAPDDWGREAQRRLAEIARCSAEGDGVTRLPFGPEHRAALDVIGGWMRRAGLDPRLDAAATLVGRREGTGPAILIGSHQDSVPRGGRYDGIMGIALGCLAVERLAAEHRLPPCPIEVLAFADEEGVRFPTALLGPRALAGTVDPAALDLTDAQGVTLADALTAFGGDPDGIPHLRRDPATVRAYLEAHIEQGPVLEARDAALGVVTAICGIERNAVTFTGETGHAGTVPMAGRRDALVAAAAFVSQIAAAAGGETRATVGTLRVRPGAVNAIPDRVDLTLELRAPDDAARDALAARARGIGAALAERHGTPFEMRRTYVQPATPCAPAIADALAAAIGPDAPRLPSGATHDASAIADLCPVGMLFLRCRGGVSHRPDEHASEDDMGAAVAALADAIARLGAGASGTARSARRAHDR